MSFEGRLDHLGQTSHVLDLAAHWQNLGPDLQNILRFVIRLYYVYRNIDLRRQ